VEAWGIMLAIARRVKFVISVAKRVTSFMIARIGKLFVTTPEKLGTLVQNIVEVF